MVIKNEKPQINIELNRINRTSKEVQLPRSDHRGTEKLDRTENIEKCHKLYYSVNKTFINKKGVSIKTKAICKPI